MRATFGSNRHGPLTTASQDVSFTYGIADGRGGSDSALATVTVVETPTPLAPIAIDDLVGPVAVGGSATVDVLANDSDPDGRVAELTVVGTDLAFPVPPTGIVTLTDLQETTRLGYTITDPDGLTATGRVTVIVVDNVAPTTVPLAVETTSNTPIEIDITPQVADADGDLLYFTCCDSLRGGTTEIVDSTPGVLRVSFVPDTDVAGAGGFSYVVDDQNGHMVAGAVTVTVQPPANTPPTASDLAVEAEAGVGDADRPRRRRRRSRRDVGRRLVVRVLGRRRTRDARRIDARGVATDRRHRSDLHHRLHASPTAPAPRRRPRSR